MSASSRLVASVGAYAWQAPFETIMSICDALEDGTESVTELASLANDPHVRSETVRVLELWRSTSRCTRSEFAAMLRGAAVAARIHGMSEGAELVWTGPTSPRASFRRTDEALLEVVRAAKHVLTLVTFAAYRIPEVQAELEAALTRRVEVRFVGETEEGGDGLRFDAARALGNSLAGRIRVFEWPRELRTADPRGRVGSLHAKCALADDTNLLVSSANLTEFAFGANLEMGVLLTGGAPPRLAARHFEDLMHSGVFRPVSNRS